MAIPNPNWAYDEIILALDLYLREGLLDDSDPRVIELSEVLNGLPIHTVRPDAEKFRNPNSVAMKLANLVSLDPSSDAQGLPQGSRRDREVWDRYSDRPDEVRRLAAEIRRGALGNAEFPAAPEEGEDEVPEGRLLYRRHRVRERDRSLVRRKKQSVLKSEGRLACEICEFDFAATYGDWGDGYIECHHIIPLSETGETKTKLADLALVCANCHRMFHRNNPWPSLDEMRERVRGR